MKYTTGVQGAATREAVISAISELPTAAPAAPPPPTPAGRLSSAELTQRRTHHILTGHPRTLFWYLGLPLMISFALQMSFTAVDRLFISWLPEPDVALSALGCAFPIELMMIALASGISQGAASSVARLLGAKNVDGAVRAAAQAMMVAGLLTLGAMTASHWVPDLMRALAVSPGELDPVRAAKAQHIAELASSFARILLWGAVAWFVPMIGSGILRGAGDMKTQMSSMLVSAVCNVALGPAMIFGLGPFPTMGIEGAALAAVISRLVGTLIVISVLAAPGSLLGRQVFAFRFDKARLVDVLRVGIPASLTTAISAVYLAILQKFLGQLPLGQAIAIAGFTFEQLAFMPVLGLNIGLTTLVGQNHGAGRLDREIASLKWACAFNVLIMSMMALIYGFGAPWLGWMYAGTNPDLAAGIADYLRINALGLPFSGVLLAVSATFGGRGRGIPSLALQAIRMFALALPLMSVLAAYGLPTLWWALPGSVAVATVLGVVWIRLDMGRAVATPSVVAPMAPAIHDRRSVEMPSAATAPSAGSE